MARPIFDIHCDLLIYLTEDNSDINTTTDIGSSIPFLKKGNVKLQTMAIFVPTEPESHKLGIQQSEIYKNLITNKSAASGLYSIEKEHLHSVQNREGIGTVVAIENASAFCDEEMRLTEGFENLESIIKNVGKLFYISLTHHAENRFGGGNYATAGLKNDGKALLDYMSGRNIVLDFSHTSDALAYDMLTYLAKQNLDIPIIASHSNYRHVWDHPRNLPDEIAKEIINQNGLIGVNFLRSFLNTENPDALYDHIAHGISLGGNDAICFGADYFYTGTDPDPSRLPYYYPTHQDASHYPDITAEIERRFGSEMADKIASQNVIRFLEKLFIS